MKYIRTNEGIFKILDKETDICVLTNRAWKYKSEIIAQADTIEELCDGFYNDILNDFDCFGFDKLYIYHDFESFKDDWKGYRTYDNWKGEGYGFIKTLKGLIYVAKMNEKGELELI